MPGKVHKLIQQLYQARGTAASSHFVRAHLVLSGIDPDDFNEYSQDDAQKVAQLERMLADFQQAPRASRTPNKERGERR